MDELIERWRAGSRYGSAAELAGEVLAAAEAAAPELLAAIEAGFDSDPDDLPGRALAEVDPESGPTGRDPPGLG